MCVKQGRDVAFQSGVRAVLSWSGGVFLRLPLRDFLKISIFRLVSGSIFGFFKVTGGVSAVCRRCRVPATFRCIRFRESGVRSAVFRENALLHYQACRAANRDVILSRRACGVSKNLLRFPQSSLAMQSCSHSNNWPYCVITARSFDFAPRFSLGSPLRMTRRTAWRPVVATNNITMPRMRRVEESA